jgi:hypothetical protein
MMNRTVIRQITFGRPFQLAGFDELQPAGTYTVETEEELLQALSFTAWRRLYTVIRLPRSAGDPMVERVVTIDPDALDVAIALDGAEGTPH